MSGTGSLGHETTSFGTLTKKAVMKFQKDHKLAATGFFGPKTRAVINQ
jgi:peptidoglycan hydrolase-like protein with peptidoglycan-binding domain